jgi:dienelactone hydrolase
VKIEEHRIETKSGDACAATIYWPDGADGELPCVVMGAGGTLTRRDGIPDYGERIAAAGLVALAFVDRHWGDSEGEPRRLISIPRQLSDWRVAVGYARSLDGVDPGRIATWGMSFGGGHAVHTASTDPRIAAAVAFVPMADGLAYTLNLRFLRMLSRAARERLKGRCMTVQAVGPAGAFAPEELDNLERLAGPNGWRNEARFYFDYPMFRHRPVRRAARVGAPVLVQLGEEDEVAPRRAIEKTAERAPRGELRRYPIDHFSGFWPENIDRVAGDQVEFLRRVL